MSFIKHHPQAQYSQHVILWHFGEPCFQWVCLCLNSPTSVPVPPLTPDHGDFHRQFSKDIHFYLTLDGQLVCHGLLVQIKSPLKVRGSWQWRDMYNWTGNQRLMRLVSNSVIGKDYDWQEPTASQGLSSLYKALPLPLRKKEKEPVLQRREYKYFVGS